MLQLMRQDYEKERLFSSTGSDELYNDILMAEEMKEQRHSGRRPEQGK
jgi:hypothetical protein